LNNVPLDGEWVVLDEDRADFNALQARIASNQRSLAAKHARSATGKTASVAKKKARQKWFERRRK